MKTLENNNSTLANFATWLRQNAIENDGLWLMKVEDTFTDEEIVNEYLNRPQIKISLSDCNVGEVFFTKEVVSQWDSLPEQAYSFIKNVSGSIIRYVVHKNIKTSDTGSKYSIITWDCMNGDIASALDISDIKENNTPNLK